MWPCCVAQPGVFGLVASDPTVSRLIARLAEDADDALATISAGRAVAREWVVHGPGSCRTRSFGSATWASVDPGWPCCPPSLRPPLRPSGR